jgi:hypothetical protein
MSYEAEIDGRELLALSEESPREVETILEMLIEAEVELVYEDEAEVA